MFTNTDFNTLTKEEFSKLVSDGRVKFEKVMQDQWEIKIDGKREGTIITDAFKGESIVSVGERVIGRITNR